MILTSPGCAVGGEFEHARHVFFLERLEAADVLLALFLIENTRLLPVPTTRIAVGEEEHSKRFEDEDNHHEEDNHVNLFQDLAQFCLVLSHILVPIHDETDVVETKLRKEEGDECKETQRG